MALGYHTEWAKRERSKKELMECQQIILYQHEFDFYKDLKQAAYFYDIPIDKGDFDIGKYFYNGKLILVEDIPKGG